MRWNKVVTLIAPSEASQDAAGVWHYGNTVEHTVFCNEFTIGMVAMAHLRSSDVRTANQNEPIDVGLRHERMLQLRSIDYHGEDRCIYEGEEYEVMYHSGSGEHIMLTIGQKIGSKRE